MTPVMTVMIRAVCYVDAAVLLVMSVIMRAVVMHGEAVSGVCISEAPR